MPPAGLLPDEAERLQELRSFDILDTISEATYDAITHLAAQICEVPIALISIVDENRQWFKSRVGLDVAETDRDFAFCAHAICEPTALMVVDDASQDSRFSENPLVAGDHSIRFYAGAPLVTAAGNVLGTLCVMDRKPRRLRPDQEKALQALSVQVMALLELRRTVRELEEELRRLEETTRRREAFLATVSHEIRTPLTSVIGYVEILRDGVRDEDRLMILETVARQAADVDFLIEDLLVAARAEAKSLTVASVPVELGAQVAQVLEGLEPATTAGIGFERRPARAIGDPARVRQIIRNLITNAIRYGGPEVTVSVSAGDGRAHLTVTDDGDGIPAADRERIFQPFQRSSDARYVASSVGLGLPIARLLAERMGGSLTYRYEDDRSVFDLELPAGG
jgi:signal transduction histidine kinase